MNELRNKKIKALVPVLVAVFSLSNPLPAMAEDATAGFNKDWSWVQNKQQNFDNAPIAAAPQNQSAAKDIFAPVPNIAAPVIQKTGDTCNDPGETDGFYRCIKTFSNGFSIVISNDQEHHGDAFKRQTRISEFDAQGRAQSRKTIRRKVNFVPFTDEKKLKSEFFDIVNRPKNKKITREVILYEYRPDTGSLKSLTWTSYEQIDETQFAMITRHIALNFDEDGNPLQGRAEKWKNQVPVERLFYWDRNMSGPLSLDTWKMWQNEILKASPRQIF